MKFILLLVLASSMGCENPVKRAVREVTYSGYEMIGVQKRDLLKRDIARTRDEQKEASETFEDALTKLRTLYSVADGKLSKQYDEVKASYASSNARAKDVRAAREKMQTVARDLFREWRGEIDQIKTAEFKTRSRQQLRASETKFAELDRSLGVAEKKMDPVLTRLNDHVLFLKHNLNAESMSALKTEHGRIEREVDGLIKDLNKTIARSDEFIRTLL